MSIIARAVALVTHPRPARLSGACTVPPDPYVTAQCAADHTLRTLLEEATSRQRDPHLHPALRSHYRLSSSVFWLEMCRRGIAQAGDGLDVIYG
jgi:hypothetical protein